MKAVRALLLSSESGEHLCSGLKEILQQHLPEQSILTTETLPYRDRDPSYNATRRPAVNRDLDILFVIMKQIERDQVAAAIRSVTADSPLLPAVLVLESCDPADVLELLRLGISDFVTTPFRPVDVVPRVLRLLDQARVKREPIMAIKEKLGLKQIVGECPAFVSVISQFPMVAGCDASVLLLGETGTGKELCARAIHYLSPRARKPFTPVNCGAIPSELVENELFGHESEAFTGASSRRTGLIQETDGGTLFLDEIDCLPLLAQAVSTGRLRRDFYYRLNTIQLLLPPLREREADIPLLAEHFLRKYSDRFGKPMARYSAAAMRMLTRYSWPGNVRELEHVIERAVVMTEGLTVAQDSISVPADGSEPAESFRDRKARMVADFEKSYIEDLLKDSEGNITRAAEAARKDRRALRLLIRKHKIDVKTFKAAAK